MVKPSTNVSEVSVSWSDVEFVLDESTLWSDANMTDSILPDSTAVESSPTETEILEQKIGEPLPAKKQPKWLKPLILLLLISTIIGLFAYYLLQDSIKDKDNNQPEGQDTQIN